MGERLGVTPASPLRHSESAKVASLQELESHVGHILPLDQAQAQMDDFDGASATGGASLKPPYHERQCLKLPLTRCGACRCCSAVATCWAAQCRCDACMVAALSPQLRCVVAF